MLTNDQTVDRALKCLIIFRPLLHTRLRAIHKVRTHPYRGEGSRLGTVVWKNANGTRGWGLTTWQCRHTQFLDGPLKEPKIHPIPSTLGLGLDISIHCTHLCEEHYNDFSGIQKVSFSLHFFKLSVGAAPQILHDHKTNFCFSTMKCLNSEPDVHSILTNISDVESEQSTPRSICLHTDNRFIGFQKNDDPFIAKWMETKPERLGWDKYKYQCWQFGIPPIGAIKNCLNGENDLDLSVGFTKLNYFVFSFIRFRL